MVELLSNMSDVLMIMMIHMITTQPILLKEKLDFCNYLMQITIISLIQMVDTKQQAKLLKLRLTHKLKQRMSLIKLNLVTLIMSTTVS